MFKTLAAAALSLLVLVAGGSAAGACEQPASSTPVLQADAVWTSLDGDLLVTVLDECAAPVTTDDAGNYIWADYAEDASGALVPVAYCEGDTVGYPFVEDASSDFGYTINF